MLLCAAFVLLYATCNYLTSLRSDVGDGAFAWERAIPFVEWSIIPYLSLVGFFAWSFFVGRGGAELDRHARRLMLALLLAVACYPAFPLRFMFERSETIGLPGQLFALLSALDLPYNRAPSLHITVLVIVWVRFAEHFSGWSCMALNGWFTLIAVSVLTTYQHHVIDVPAGLVVAGICIALTSRSRPRLESTRTCERRRTRFARDPSVHGTERANSRSSA